MVKLICFVKRNPALDVDEFHREWRGRHAELIRDHAAARRYLVRYEQNHRLARDYERGGDFDGVAIQWFRSARDFFAMVADPSFEAEIRSDERRLLDLDATVFVLTEEEETMIPPSGP